MADKKQPQVLEQQYYTPPPKLSGWESFSLFMWNSETSEFLGRTAGSWGKFSIEFYVCIVLLQFNSIFFFSINIIVNLIFQCPMSF